MWCLIERSKHHKWSYVDGRNAHEKWFISEKWTLGQWDDIAYLLERCKSRMLTSPSSTRIRSNRNSQTLQGDLRKCTATLQNRLMVSYKVKQSVFTIWSLQQAQSFVTTQREGNMFTQKPTHRSLLQLYSWLPERNG